MSLWMVGFLLFALQNSGVYAEDNQKPTIGEQLDVIIKDVTQYLLWMFGLDEAPVEEDIEVSEILAEGFLKDVNDMIDLMHEEADKHIKHAKDIRKKDSDEDKKDSNEKENSEEKKPRKKETSKDTSETDDKRKEGSNMTVIPI